MPAATSMRSTQGRGRLFDSILDTVGDTPAIRVNNLAIEGRTIYVKAEVVNPAWSVKDRLALNVIEAAERAGTLGAGPDGGRDYVLGAVAAAPMRHSSSHTRFHVPRQQRFS